MDIEVIAVEIFNVSVFSSVLLNVDRKDSSLILENSNVLVPDPVSLRLDALSESKVHDVGLLGLELNIGILHFLLHGLLLSLQVLFRLHGHTNLGELEDDFEENEEGDHRLSHGWVRNGLKESSLLSILVHVDLLGNVLDPSLLKNRWVSLLDSLGERVGACENFLSLLTCISGLRVAGCEDTDVVEKRLASLNSWSSACLEDLFDLLKRLLINCFDEPSLVLVHGYEQLVEIGELFSAFLHLLFFLSNLPLDALVLLVSLFLLSEDL